MSESPIRVIFAGTPDFAVPSLEALVNDPQFEVLFVISQPDKPVGRKQELLPTPVKACALKHGIEVVQPKDINHYPLLAGHSLGVGWSTIHFDFLVVVAYGQILKQDILDAPQIAPVNVHASLLPQWRGASPMQSAILAGDVQTGVTIQRMVKKLDAGPILSQVVLPLKQHTTIDTLHDQLASAGAALLIDTLSKPLVENEQEEEAMSMCHKLNRKMGNVDVATMNAEEIDRHVRALVPWPGVRVYLAGQEVKLLTVSLIPTEESIPLQCKDTELHIVTLQPPGKKPMTGLAWHRGHA
ncbi:MAG: methionyl-tRNA formyltransferase [bacterium]|nr:methionyl-tRNA formyltransferase [bacterium]